MSKYIVDIHGDIEGDYEIIGKYLEPKIGHWIRHKENCCYNKCSICEYEHCKESNYCPNCGAKMQEAEE